MLRPHKIIQFVQQLAHMASYEYKAVILGSFGATLLSPTISKIWSKDMRFINVHCEAHIKRTCDISKYTARPVLNEHAIS